MGFSSRKWADIISKTASRLYFFIIIVRVPLFRFPCRVGICQTPIDIMVCQLIVSQIFPEVVIKALLYPGAIKRSLMEGKTVPDPDHLLNSYKSNMGEGHASTDLRHLEIVAGSYLCVGGALLGLMGRGRMSLFGLILIIWGVARDVRKLIRCCKCKSIAKWLKNYSKAKNI
ncbi:hypothetical protein CDL12_16557 [Handroanthus impetiginosus]|uniref:Uncharacterized protein n=1 Tax=Handroanthus impetiginosus TaxID=429701 RepID=A0A2G9GZZ5_9LAMI|nr:hypothetical protein CDL12_16557 [Handroanthus impetiginosus]